MGVQGVRGGDLIFAFKLILVKLISVLNLQLSLEMQQNSYPNSGDVDFCDVNIFVRARAI